MIAEFNRTWGKALANLKKFDVARKKVQQGLEMAFTKVFNKNIDYFNDMVKLVF